MSAVPIFTPTLADAELETDFNMQMMIVMDDKRFSRCERVAAFEKACDLHRQRRPEMIEHLERSRGLRK